MHEDLETAILRLEEVNPDDADAVACGRAAAWIRGQIAAAQTGNAPILGIYPGGLIVIGMDYTVSTPARNVLEAWAVNFLRERS